MNTYKYYLILLLLIFGFSKSYSQYNCNLLPKNFNSYIEAEKKIQSSTFKIKEHKNTNSSWIKSASYFSCDGKTGYFFLKTKDKNYIYKNLPVDKWNGFKNSSSHGSYYNAHIKNKYEYYLSI